MEEYVKLQEIFTNVFASQDIKDAIVTKKSMNANPVPVIKEQPVWTRYVSYAQLLL